MKHWFDVVMPWNPSNADEGTYSALVLADDVSDALSQVSALMASAYDTNHFESDKEREDWRRLIEQEVQHVGRADVSVEQAVLKIYGEELGFPQEDHVRLDSSVFRQLLAQHKDQLLVPIAGASDVTLAR